MRDGRQLARTQDDQAEYITQLEHARRICRDLIEDALIVGDLDDAKRLLADCERQLAAITTR